VLVSRWPVVPLADVLGGGGFTRWLEDITLGRLLLDPDHGYIVTKMDLGHPSVRAVSNDRVGASGAIDTTAFHSSRAVTLEVSCFDTDQLSRRDVIARLRAYTSPGRRPALVWQEDDGVDRRVLVRGDSTGWALEKAGLGAAVSVQVAFVAPDGVLETLAQTTADVSALPTPGAGLGFPVTLPTAFPKTSTYNTTRVMNNGTEAAPPVFQLWGPCTSPLLLNLSTGQRLSLPGLTLTAQQYAEVDVANATILLNGRPAESLYAYQEWGVSSFFWLAPGRNLLRYTPASFSEDAHAVVRFRERSI